MFRHTQVQASEGCVFNLMFVHHQLGLDFPGGESLCARRSGLAKTFNRDQKVRGSYFFKKL